MTTGCIQHLHLLRPLFGADRDAIELAQQNVQTLKRRFEQHNKVKPRARYGLSKCEMFWVTETPQICQGNSRPIQRGLIAAGNALQLFLSIENAMLGLQKYIYGRMWN